MNKPFIARAGRLTSTRLLGPLSGGITPLAPEALDLPTLLSLIREMGEAAIRKQSAGEACDPKQDGAVIDFFDELAKLARRVRRSIGRPQRVDVTEALKLEAAGVSRKEIYRQLAKQTPAEQHALREAMRIRKHRNKAAANK